MTRRIPLNENWHCLADIIDSEKTHKINYRKAAKIKCLDEFRCCCLWIWFDRELFILTVLVGRTSWGVQHAGGGERKRKVLSCRRCSDMLILFCWPFLCRNMHAAVTIKIAARLEFITFSAHQLKIAFRGNSLGIVAATICKNEQTFFGWMREWLLAEAINIRVECRFRDAAGVEWCAEMRSSGVGEGLWARVKGQMLNEIPVSSLRFSYGADTHRWWHRSNISLFWILCMINDGIITEWMDATMCHIVWITPTGRSTLLFYLQLPVSWIISLQIAGCMFQRNDN